MVDAARKVITEVRHCILKWSIVTKYLSLSFWIFSGGILSLLDWFQRILHAHGTPCDDYLVDTGANYSCLPQLCSFVIRWLHSALESTTARIRYFEKSEWWLSFIEKKRNRRKYLFCLIPYLICVTFVISLQICFVVYCWFYFIHLYMFHHVYSCRFCVCQIRNKIVIIKIISILKEHLFISLESTGDRHACFVWY